MAVVTSRGVVVLIAAYNEAKSIRDTVSRARQKGYPVIVVDDGSSDGTAAAVQGMDGVEVLVSERNEGKGASLRKGIDRFLQRHETALVMMDADGQHD
ncbi:MAG TPA: glycosyltransferase family 2 protein, partial [Candidatus Omnitrophota bacterium]|nr:glycosyltransferase family 2 protein [Candidatus Omnitrophota bacterium]